MIGILREPGPHLLPLQRGPSAFLVNWLGSRRVLDMRLDQSGLRSNPVNSEEGAPMGVGIWYEMYISEPVSYLFKNAERQAAAIRPRIAGEALKTITANPEVAAAVFEIPANQKTLENKGELTLLPPRSALLSQLVTARDGASRRGRERHGDSRHDRSGDASPASATMVRARSRRDASRLRGVRTGSARQARTCGGSTGRCR